MSIEYVCWQFLMYPNAARQRFTTASCGCTGAPSSEPDSPSLCRLSNSASRLTVHPSHLSLQQPHDHHTVEPFPQRQVLKVLLLRAAGEHRQPQYGGRVGVDPHPRGGTYPGCRRQPPTWCDTHSHAAELVAATVTCNDGSWPFNSAFPSTGAGCAHAATGQSRSGFLTYALPLSPRRPIASPRDWRPRTTPATTRTSLTPFRSGWTPRSESRGSLDRRWGRLRIQSHATGSVVVVPLTAQVVEAPITRVPINANEMSGIAEDSFAMVDKITTVRRSQLGKRAGRATPAQMVDVERALLVFLGLAR